MVLNLDLDYTLQNVQHRLILVVRVRQPISKRTFFFHFEHNLYGCRTPFTIVDGNDRNQYLLIKSRTYFSIIFFTVQNSYGIVLVFQLKILN